MIPDQSVKDLPRDRSFRWKRKAYVLGTWGLLTAVSALLTGIAIILIPADTRDDIFLGFSAQRLILLGVVTVGAIMALALTMRAFQDRAWAEAIWRWLLEQAGQAKVIRWGTGCGLLAGVMLSLMPAYRFGGFEAYFVRLHPLVVWLTFLSGLTFVVAWVEKYGFPWGRLVHVLNMQRRVWKSTLLVLIILALIWILISVTGFGVTVVEDYWYGAGIPVLGVQILLALCAGLGMFVLERRYTPIFSSRTDPIVFFLVWVLSAFLWVREPLLPSYFAPGPYPPANEYYPYSDSVFYDLASQFTLIGQGLNNGAFVGRALYIHFLVLMHALLGQDFARLMAWQAGIFAVFPAILYLLGKEMHSRPFGVLLAVLIALRGLNGIAASSMINLANQKQMLTDFPTAIFVAIFTYLVVRWLKAPQRDYSYLLAAGGVIGLGSMLRTHLVLLFFFALLLTFMVYKKWSYKFIVSALFSVVLLATIIPWGMQSGGSLFNVYLQGIRSVIEQRYHLNPPSPTPSSDPQGNRLHIARNIERNRSASKEILVSAIDVDPLTPVGPSISLQQDDPSSRPLPVFVSTHLLHNILTSVFILPVSPLFHDLDHTVSDTGPFWDEYWVESFGPSILPGLIMNLFLIALGLAVAGHIGGIRCLVPVGSFFVYALANSFARTSGGRYIVPIDWIVLLYFSLGLFQILLWGISIFSSPEISAAPVEKASGEQLLWTWRPLKRAPWILAIFLMIGTLLPVSDTLFPRRYEDQSQAELLAVLEGEGYLQQAGIDRATLEIALERWSAFEITSGRALYPRFYLRDKGEPKAVEPYGERGFPRVGFMLIGPNGLNSVILPLANVPYLPNASDVMVIGCRSNTHIDALVIVVMGEETAVYMREPAAAIRCPAPEPVCDENRICR